MELSFSAGTVGMPSSSVLSGLRIHPAPTLRLRSTRKAHALGARESEHYEHIALPAGGMLVLNASSGIWRLRTGCLRLAEASAEECQHLAWPGDWVGPETMLGRWRSLHAVAVLPVELERVASLPHNELEARLLRQSWRQAEDMLALRSRSVAERLRYLHQRLESCRRSRGAKVMPRLKDIALIIDATVETVCRMQGSVLRSSS